MIQTSYDSLLFLPLVEEGVVVLFGLGCAGGWMRIGNYEESYEGR